MSNIIRKLAQEQMIPEVCVWVVVVCICNQCVHVLTLTLTWPKPMVSAAAQVKPFITG